MWMQTQKHSAHCPAHFSILSMSSLSESAKRIFCTGCYPLLFGELINTLRGFAPSCGLITLLTSSSSISEAALA